MKRSLSLVLALVMILGSFSAVFAAEADAVKEASDLLVKAGVLVGDTQGNLNLDENLLRQDTVVLVSKLMGAYDEAAKTEDVPTYEDVRDNFYLPLLAWAQKNETFVGHSDANFGFGENLTAQEYAKVLLVALEYTVGPNGDKDVSWKDALVKAKDLGILENVKVENETEILRGDMAVMTFNALGVKVKGSEKTLADKLGITMPAAAELTAKVNTTENLKEVKVELSNAKLANAEKLANKDNYRVDKIKVERVTIDGNDVILELEKALIKNRSYDLTVRNIDKAINKTYSFKANDNASPKVVKVEALGEYGIKVTTSEPVNNPKERNFLVDGKNIAMNIERYGRDLILTPYHKSAFSVNADTLTIKELEDFAGYKSALEDFEVKVEKDDEAPVVEDVVVKGNVVEVTFDKDVYADSVEGYVNRKDEGNVSYRSGRQTVFTIAEYEKDGITYNYGNKFATNKVRYVFEDNLPRGTEVTIEGVQNHSKVTMKSVTVLAREVKDNLEPEIIDVKTDTDVAARTATITLEFDKNVSAPSKSNFALYTEEVLRRRELTEGTDYTISVDYKSEKETNIVVVKLGGLTENNKEKEFDYILEVSNFEDYSRNRMFRDYVEFELVKGKTLVVEEVRFNEHKDETVITIDFNYAVDRVRAEDLTNYLFRTKADAKAKDVKDLDGEIIVSSNGKRVTIELPEFKFNDYKDAGLFEVLEGVRDKDGNKLAKRLEIAYGVNYKAEEETPDVPAVDEKELDEALAKVEAIVEDDYTAESYAAYAEALEKAKEMPEKTQEEVDAKVKAINEALEMLVEKEEEGEEPGDEATLEGEIEVTIYGDFLVVQVGDATEVDNVTINGEKADYGDIEDGELRVADVKAGDKVIVTIAGEDKTVKF